MLQFLPDRNRKNRIRNNTQTEEVNTIRDHIWTSYVSKGILRSFNCFSFSFVCCSFLLFPRLFKHLRHKARKRGHKTQLNPGKNVSQYWKKVVYLILLFFSTLYKLNHKKREKSKQVSLRVVGRGGEEAFWSQEQTGLPARSLIPETQTFPRGGNPGTLQPENCIGSFSFFPLRPEAEGIFFYLFFFIYFLWHILFWFGNGEEKVKNYMVWFRK